MTPREAKKRLNQILTDEEWRKHPNYRRDLTMPIKHYEVKKANGLTQAIIAVLKSDGWQAERISSMGRMIDNREEFTDVLGFRRTIGSIGYIPGTGTPGTADISATIKGRAVKIEVKIGRDRQSKAQKKYQKDIERAGGIYTIAKTLEGFFEWYDEFITNLNK